MRRRPRRSAAAASPTSSPPAAFRRGRHYNQAVRALNTIALFIRRGSPPEYGTFGQMLSEAEGKLEEVEQGRQVIEYVLADIAGSTSVSGD